PRLESRTLSRTVDAQGAVALEEPGDIVVRGITLDQAEKLFKNQLRRFYKDVEVAVSLGKMRTIQVTVSGDVYQPGSYAVPAVATAYNLLYACGGPTNDGTLRQIEVRRGGNVAGTLDIYRFLLSGENATDIPLQNGDLVYVGNSLTRVAVSGE